MDTKSKNCSARVSLRFSNPYYNNIVRSNTENIARKAGFDEDQVFETVMAVDEAYTNAVEHSKIHDTEIIIEIEYFLYNDKLEVLIKDTGCGFNISDDTISESLKTNFSSRGRGLSLIKCLSDQFDLNTRVGIGTEIRIVKFLKKVVAED